MERENDDGEERNSLPEAFGPDCIPLAKALRRLSD